MPYPTFDRSKLKLRPLSEREHDITIDQFPTLNTPIPPFDNPKLDTVTDRIVAARQKDRPVVLMIGAHVIRSGAAPYLIDLMERGLITHIAGNGACAIHDFELALIGATTESVPRYIRTGEFGLWTESGTLNTIAQEAVDKKIGLGEAVGQHIIQNNLPHANISVFAAAVRLNIPITAHVSLGYDIVHEHPNCDGASIGASSYTDFLVFTESVSHLEGGVLLNIGTAIMGPEVYLKALAMVRNVAHQENRTIAKFTTAVFDLIPLGDDIETEAPKTDARYYYRPFKTILVRTVRDGGESYYIQGDHKVTIPNLYQQVVTKKESIPC
ncbi:MAG: hypothetical protein ACI8V2_001739 [Candidatus Latescibacterota bacterium]|jgi:hypothetical protein